MHNFDFSSLAPNASNIFVNSVHDCLPPEYTFYMFDLLYKIICQSSTKASAKVRFSLLKSHGHDLS